MQLLKVRTAKALFHELLKYSEWGKRLYCTLAVYVVAPHVVGEWESLAAEMIHDL